jgi:acyl-homoserine-lactone acylase
LRFAAVPSRTFLLPVVVAVLAPLVLLPAGCAPVRTWFDAPQPSERLARSVTIVRDEWGVPTIYGQTDAAVAFGLAWAQAEDNYWQIEEDYIHALGRAAHYYGDRFLAADLVRAAFEVERLAREEYAREPAERRAVWDGFAAGLNHYLRTAGVQPRLIVPWEPWMFLARLRTVGAGTTVGGVRLGFVAAGAEPFQLVGVWDDAAVGEAPRGHDAPHGSAAWAVGPGRTAAGHALLFQNADAAFFGPGQPYEAQVHSASGWHARGIAMLGTPVLRSGHNERLAWTHTDAGAGQADVYAVAFDHPTDPLAYRYDGEWRQATEWEDTVRVNTADGVVSRTYRFRRTHHGPIVALHDGRALAVRSVRHEEGGALQQWLDMSRARNLDEFRAALNQRALPTASTLYADVDGNIYYLHGNAVPRRDASFDWSLPVDGNTAATEWRGWHELNELIELLNPAAGWLQSTSVTPLRTPPPSRTAPAGVDPAAARYHGDAAAGGDDERARAARRLLAAETSWAFDSLARAAFDTYVNDAAPVVPALVLEWEQVGGFDPHRAARADAAIDALRSWDHVSSIESEAMTLYVLWQERLRLGEYRGEYARFRALEDAVARLERDWGTALVRWGDVNRLQRVHTSGVEPFSDAAPSLPVAGGPGWAGMVFRFQAVQGPARQRFGVSGHAWVSVVELRPDGIRSRAVVPFGQSADPASPHFFDQAPLYASGELRTAWFARDDVMANARRVYHPGAPGHAP